MIKRKCKTAYRPSMAFSGGESLNGWRDVPKHTDISEFLPCDPNKVISVKSVSTINCTGTWMNSASMVSAQIM